MEQESRQGEIRILDPETISRISAGEVVERPASVVKELVENALDAGAGRIEVEITSRQGSITGIRITDNGSGMTHEDADLACVRHATSKIRALPDLSVVHSLGFRGEALASIAAVSRLTLTTRKRGSPICGVRIVNEGGRVIERGDCGSPEGTSVEVEEIFFNTPARKKFMRSLPAEMAYITGILERIILSHPEVSFRVLHNRKVLMSGPGGSVHDAALHLFGTDVAGALIPVDFSGSYIRVKGEISHPSLSRQNPYQVFIGINHRPVQSKALSLAVKEGYGTLLSSDRFPMAILLITIDPTLVDVNVHPTKREVRISREKEVREEISRAVEMALQGRDLTFEARDPARQSTQATIFPASKPIRYRMDETASARVAEPARYILADTERRLRQTELALPAGEGEGSPVPELEILGQLDNTYILACPRGGEDLILIDQHAAHERILYEQVQNAGEREPECQELIVPVTLHLSPRETSILPALLPVLEGVGFLVEEFGKETFSVRAIPVLLGKHVEHEGVREVISSLLSGEIRPGPSCRDRIMKVIACRGAIKGGTPLTPEQCRTLIAQLRRTTHPFSCPHGRPTMVTFKKRDLDGLFLRT
ncbi:MAG: DNA mismatch repair endonuclease MutL [Methanolinea sp.]|jgi:DNA mismatch repair protein MutL|nr:DNA mismatch repair endonuclease MutL [Methanolinea sp.]